MAYRASTIAATLTFMYIVFRMDKKLIRYTVACVNEFAANKSLTEKQAFDYLCNHGAMDFLVEFYDVEHTLSFEDAVNDLTLVSQQNGGKIQ